MVEATVDRSFAAFDVVEWMFPPNVLARMRDAFGMTLYTGSKGEYEISSSSYQWYVQIACNMVVMVPPRSDLVRLNQEHPKNDAISEFLTTVENIYGQFQKLRDVLHWLDIHATAGAIKYYLPVVAALIPESDSAFHRANGICYNEPQGVSVHLPAIRAAASLIANALLVPEQPEYEGLVTIAGMIKYEYQNSQSFRLV